MYIKTVLFILILFIYFFFQKPRLVSKLSLFLFYTTVVLAALFFLKTYLFFIRCGQPQWKAGCNWKVVGSGGDLCSPDA